MYIKDDENGKVAVQKVKCKSGGGFYEEVHINFNDIIYIGICE